MISAESWDAGGGDGGDGGWDRGRMERRRSWVSRGNENQGAPGVEGAAGWVWEAQGNPRPSQIIASEQKKVHGFWLECCGRHTPQSFPVASADRGRDLGTHCGAERICNAPSEVRIPSGPPADPARASPPAAGRP